MSPSTPPSPDDILRAIKRVAEIAARHSPYVNMPAHLVSMRAWNAARAYIASDGQALPQAHELLRRYRQNDQVRGATDWRSILILATGADPEGQ
jgi:hypothetical protein